MSCSGLQVAAKSRRLTHGLVLVALAWLLAVTLPAAALAHGPVSPLASSFLARVTGAPAGFDVKVVDGDQRLWLSVPASSTVVILDYRGAPYLRFSPSGVAVNDNSEMYYLNQTPIAETPPSNLSRTTPPNWQRVSGGHAYGWHDGRLHALATVARLPGASYVGRWTVPVLVGGRQTGIAGGLWHRDAPSPAWFWAIAVLVLCLLAAWRVRSPRLDAGVARGLAATVLIAIAVASIGRQLHGRPGISGFSVAELVVILALVAVGLRLALRRRIGFLTIFVVAFVSVWEGVTLLTTLLNGYVLMAVPAAVARAATVICLGGGIGLVLLALRLAERPGRATSPPQPPVTEYRDEHGGVAPHAL